MTTHIDVHVLQSVPPSNMNRDETGSPKTAVYGGKRRARVSSQAWKRATRKDFDNHIDQSGLGVRTKRAVELLSERIQHLAPELTSEHCQERAEKVLEKAGLKVKARRKAEEGEAGLTEYLMFFSNIQLDKLAELAVCPDEEITAKATKSILKSGNSIDLALFGRMVANDADLNVDAACQVAHAISTHAVSNEFDYYTAVDDANPAEDTGAGMIGTIEFNSATLYRFATVNLAALNANLGDSEATTRAVQAFIRSFVGSMPTGKANTFANATLPDAIVVTARKGRPISYVGAFEAAVDDRNGGYVRASCAALAEYATAVSGAFGDDAQQTWVCAVKGKDELAGLGAAVSLDQLVDEVGSVVHAALSES